jgi:hypothetical protein
MFKEVSISTTKVSSVQMSSPNLQPEEYKITAKFSRFPFEFKKINNKNKKKKKKVSNKKTLKKIKKKFKNQ